MSMSKDECLHDCTCTACSVVYPGVEDIEVHCDLPEGHAPGSQHWDPTWGWWRSG